MTANVTGAVSQFEFVKTDQSWAHSFVSQDGHSPVDNRLSNSVKCMTADMICTLPCPCQKGTDLSGCSQPIASLDLPQGLMQALQDQGILVAVFDQLDDVSDMIRCATVSKAWRQASNHARPSRLCISWVEAQVSRQTEGQDTPPSAALSAVQTWLQHKHARGVFQRVQELSISMKPSFTQGVSLRELVLCESPLCNFSLHRFWRKLLHSAEGWPVQSCNLESANESLESTVKLLPKTVRHLNLCIGRLTETIYLSLFDRFPCLQSVELRSTNRHFRSTFILDRSAFKLVQKDLLYIEPFKVSRTCSMVACQRRYTQVAPHIYTFTDP